MDTSLLRKIDLESGLELEIYDVSRKLAGDRWYVGFIVRVEIPITFLAGHADSPEVDIEKMKDVLGETVRFEQKRDRHYIDEKEKDALLNGLIDDFLASTLPYFLKRILRRSMPLKHTKKSLKKRHGLRREMSGSNSWDRCPPNNFLLLSGRHLVVSAETVEKPKKGNL